MTKSGATSKWDVKIHCKTTIVVFEDAIKGHHLDFHIASCCEYLITGPLWAAYVVGDIGINTNYTKLVDSI